MTLYVWTTATGWLPKQSTTVNKIGNISIAAISDHRERIAASSRENRDIAFEGNKILIFPAMESHGRVGMKITFKIDEVETAIQYACAISTYVCVTENVQEWHTWIPHADMMCVSPASRQILMDSSEDLHRHGRKRYVVSGGIRAQSS